MAVPETVEMDAMSSSNADKPSGRPPSDADVEPDDALRGLIGYNMRRALGAVQARVTQTLKQFDLRIVTYGALSVITENPGLRQSQLAQALAIDRTNIVMIVDELEARKLITRERAKTDRRAYALRVTPEGARLYRAAMQADRENEAAFLRDFSAEDIARFARDLQRVERAAKQMK